MQQETQAVSSWVEGASPNEVVEPKELKEEAKLELRILCTEAEAEERLSSWGHKSNKECTHKLAVWHLMNHPRGFSRDL